MADYFKSKTGYALLFEFLELLGTPPLNEAVFNEF